MPRSLTEDQQRFATEYANALIAGEEDCLQTAVSVARRARLSYPRSTVARMVKGGPVHREIQFQLDRFEATGIPQGLNGVIRHLHRVMGQSVADLFVEDEFHPGALRFKRPDELLPHEQRWIREVRTWWDRVPRVDADGTPSTDAKGRPIMRTVQYFSYHLHSTMDVADRLLRHYGEEEEAPDDLSRKLEGIPAKRLRDLRDALQQALAGGGVTLPGETIRPPRDKPEREVVVYERKRRE